MRIVGGKYRGRTLIVPKSNNIRPTRDRTRESLFNILQHSYRDFLKNGRLLELFAGTGAVGIEALSRGADHVLFVENSIEGRGLLRLNIERFSLEGCTRIFKRDATKPGFRGKAEPFNMLFADPPYGQNLGERAIKSAADHQWLTPQALVILEEHKAIEPTFDKRFIPIDKRHFGNTNIWFYMYSEDNQAPLAI